MRRLIGNGDADHDDLVQTSLIAVIDSVGRFRGESSLDTWVARVTANTLFKAIRRRSSEHRKLEANHERYSLTSTESSASAIESRDLLGRVRAILDTMDPVKAFAVLLHDVLGYDLREISEITEASVAAAQSRLVRGREELQERLKQDPELAELLERRAAP